MNRILLFALVVLVTACRTKEIPSPSQESPKDSSEYADKYRPQFHFSPRAFWMNDPNGMVYYNGEYHLFYQHYPGGTKWGPMHWGHAISTDLVHWEHLPIALYPDSLGYIFSGSAIVDTDNTSGFGDGKNPPLVAIYTYHSDTKEKAGADDFQYQGIAYSNDSGRTWNKYNGNPVLKNQGIRDFRDPKVFWHAPTKKWVMILAVKDHIELWNSSDLKGWNKLSDFGFDYGSHGGVWECPDLFELPVANENTKKWVLLLSINPGGPNGGSATQYFLGDFDGKTFKSETSKKDTLWIDYGPDDYAGVTWSNAPNDRRIFLGWMSNWDYAQVVPTEKWRSATTVPRDLALMKTPKGYRLASSISPELINASATGSSMGEQIVKDSVTLNTNNTPDLSKAIIEGEVAAGDFEIVFSNARSQRVVVGFDKMRNQFYIDRSKSGELDFSNAFTKLIYADRFSDSRLINFTIAVDESSLEVFFDDGTSVMTAIFFADQPLTSVALKVPSPLQVKRIGTRTMKSIWK